MVVRSAWLRLTGSGTSFWLMNHDNTSALIMRARRPIIHRLAGPPMMMYVPLGFKTRLESDNEWFQTQSRTRS